MNKDGRVEVAGLVFVGNKLLHDTGVTVWAVLCHNHQFLLDYTFIFSFSVSLIFSGYISSYMFLWIVWLGYLKWQIKRWFFVIKFGKSFWRNFAKEYMSGTFCCFYYFLYFLSSSQGWLSTQSKQPPTQKLLF